jgi:hypothetical protein
MAVGRNELNHRIARCHCGALKLVCRGAPTKISMCHCLDCQRRTGSAFSIAVFFAQPQVAVMGTTRVYERPSASGFPVAFHFCETCGSNVYWLPARLPHLIGVAAGAFEDPLFPQPVQSVWGKDRHPWLSLPANIPEYQENPPERPPKQ